MFWKRRADDERDLYIAIRRGDFHGAKRLLDSGVSPNGVPNGAVPPLHLAATLAKAEICRLLLAKGAEPGPMDQWGFRALDLAVRAGCSRTTKALLDGGCDPNLSDGAGGFPLLDAVTAGREDISRLLLSAGADINKSDETGRTSLHEAARLADEGMVVLLLDLGAHPAAVDGEGRTPLHLLASIINLARPGRLPRPPMPIETVLRLVMAAGIDGKDLSGSTPLHTAARAANPEMCRILIDLGADALAIDGTGRTPYEVARSPARQLIERYMKLVGMDIRICRGC